MAAAQLRLRKNLARAIAQGHPWLYRDAFRPSPPLPDGAIVEVLAPSGRPLARGFWDSVSPIAVRILVAEPRAGDLLAAVDKRVADALARRLAAIDRARTDAFRWIHGEADGLPGVHADLYGTAVALRFDGAGAQAFYRNLPAAMETTARAQGIALGAVIERRRGPRGSANNNDQAEARESAIALRGQLPPAEIVVRENDLLFGVDLAHGQKGGLFVDQRDNRALVRTLSDGRRVLNLFGYTGGFSLYAAAGGARDTTTVDIGRQAIAAARRNFERNGFDLDRATFAVEDAFVFLQDAARAGRQWDLVISDPPSFAPSSRSLPQALAAYRRLHRLAAAVTAPGGIFCAASCSSHVDKAAFLATVTEGARDAGRRFALDSCHGAGADHPVVPHFPEGGYLKFAVGRL
ncbi:MAG TPA: class I SAM-dependent rRNA methyltransferase [Polyangia bacterium]